MDMFKFSHLFGQLYVMDFTLMFLARFLFFICFGMNSRLRIEKLLTRTVNADGRIFRTPELVNYFQCISQNLVRKIRIINHCSSMVNKRRVNSRTGLHWFTIEKYIKLNSYLIMV